MIVTVEHDQMPYPIPQGLGPKQRLFAVMVADLILTASRMGYTVSFGETKRSDEQAEINAIGPAGRKALCEYLREASPPGEYSLLAAKIENNSGSGIRGSLHELGLAIDLNLFRKGEYLPRTEDHEPLGRYWERIGGTWGGRFGDGNHYSLQHDGKK